MVPLLVYLGYGVGDAEAFVYCHDWLYGVGTLVSLFIIPLIYWFIYRKHDKNEVH